MDSGDKVTLAYDLVDKALRLLYEVDIDDALEGPIWEAISATNDAGIAISQLLFEMGREDY